MSRTVRPVIPRPLTHADLPAVRRLASVVADVDGLTLKLEWGMLADGRAHGFVIPDPDPDPDSDGAIAGFLGCYPFGAIQVEFCGMVAPAWRRRGLATRLLDAGLADADARGIPSRLLIVPRTAIGGQDLAARRGTGLDHSEHSMRLTRRPSPPDRDPAVALVPATAEHRTELEALLTLGFGAPPPPGLLALGEDPRARTMLITCHGCPVGTLRLARDGEEGAIYGFTVDPAERGRGIGAQALALGCAQLIDHGASTVRLEVEVQNDRALGLYLRAGFATVSTEDYHRLPGPV